MHTKPHQRPILQPVPRSTVRRRVPPMVRSAQRQNVQRQMQLQRQVQRKLRPPAGMLIFWLDAGLWIGMAIAFRLYADLVLLSFPFLWPLVVLVLLAPAAIAIGLSTWMPPLSLLLGYRLILVALGFILGGR